MGDETMPNRYRMALITGATSGIGAAFSAALPPETGLLLTGRDRGRLAEEAAKYVRDGRRVETVAADLATGDGVAAVVAAARTHQVDLLINNAGFGVYGRSLDNGRQTELEMIALNVTAVVDLVHSLLPGMVDRARAENRRAGMIVVSSTVAFVPMPLFAAYGATKAFELHYTEALAEEMADAPVDILTLCPGATRTNFFARAGMSQLFPGHAEDADDVARKALAALGRRHVLVSRGRTRVSLWPLSIPRRLVSIAARRVLHRNARRQTG
jgi:short-subunit dehydrogenase